MRMRRANRRGPHEYSRHRGYWRYLTVGINGILNGFCEGCFSACWLDRRNILDIISISLIIFTMISHAIGRQVRASGLSALDRSIGLVFGLGLGVVLVSIGYIGLVWAMDLPKETAKQPQWIQDSKFRPLLKWGAGQLQELAPKGLVLKPITSDDSSESLKQRFEKLVTPETKKSANSQRDGYNQQERREMDRLIKGQQ